MDSCLDLGSKQHIGSYFDDFNAGKQLAHVKVLTSIVGREMKNARSTKPSVKNIQLEVICFPSSGSLKALTPHFTSPVIFMNFNDPHCCAYLANRLLCTAAQHAQLQSQDSKERRR